jgi:hypothetical protein
LRHASFFQRLYTQYKERAIFLGVYITEAHAADEWPVGRSISFCNQPKDISERCGLARKFVDTTKLELPMLVDTMGNQFESTFAAWPVRFYVIKDGKLVFKAQPNLDDYAYDVLDLTDWLEGHS